MEPIDISDCPISGLQRKVVSYRLQWLEDINQIIVNCLIHHYKDGEHVSNNAIQDFNRLLIASDTPVDPNTGVILEEATETSITEYQFYMNIIEQPVLIRQLLQNVILLRDSQGKFNI